MTGTRIAFPHAVDVVDPLWIPLSDGTRLAARLWRPVGVARAPVVLEYLPYRRADGTDIDDATRHRYFAGHGFASVRVDIRGTGDSDGLLTDEYSAAEIADGVEVVTWLAAQPWCNGRVGLLGISWGGFNALQIAAEMPPALAAIVTVCSTDDRHADDVHYMGGAVLARDMLGWATTLIAFNARPPDPVVVGTEWREQWHRRVAATPAFVDTWLAHPARDAYWRHGSVCENYGAIRCPVLAVGGWADGYPNAVLRLLEHLPGTRRGILGPWAHAWPHAARPGPRIGFLQECVRWWGRWLRDESNAVMDAPLLRAWIESPSAPPAADRPGAWYGGGLPVEEAKFRLPAQRVVANLAHGRAAGEWCPFGSHETAADQRDDDAISTCIDLPVDTDIVLLGRARLHFRALDRLLGGHLIVRLCDVDPNGSSSLIAWGVAAVRTGRVDLKAAGRRVPRGHRLRVALARTYWPVLWPARDIETLDVTDMALVLPLAPAATEAVTFEAAEAAPAGACDVLRPGRFVRQTADGVAVRLLDGGRVRHGNGIVVESESEDRLTLGEHAASATVQCRRRMSLERDDWRVDVRVEASMRAEGDAFTVDVRLEAEEPGHTLLAPRQWRARLPRPPE